MKNLIMFGLVAVCSVLISSESIHAAVLGGGGGKTASKARVILTNVEPPPNVGKGIASWVRPVGTALPATLGALRSQLIYLAPGKTGQTSKLKNGNYGIAIVDAANTAGPDNTALTPALVAGIVIADVPFAINGVNRTANVSTNGVVFTK